LLWYEKKVCALYAKIGVDKALRNGFDVCIDYNRFVCIDNVSIEIFYNCVGRLQILIKKTSNYEMDHHWHLPYMDNLITNGKALLQIKTRTAHKRDGFCTREYLTCHNRRISLLLAV